VLSVYMTLTAELSAETLNYSIITEH